MALDWSLYDRWLRTQAVAPPSPELVLIVRDPASEARLGAGAWDRAVLARMVTSLARAGAAVIGVDVPLGRPGGPGPGGAVGDALLGDATAMAGTVVYPLALEPGRSADALDRAERAHRSWPMAVTPRAAWLEGTPLARTFPGLAQHAKGLGHVLAPAEADGVVRRAPVFVRVHDRAVPAFALALLAAFVGAGGDGIVLDAAGVVVHGTPERGGIVRIPTDPRGRVLVEFTGTGLPEGVQVVPFAEAWAAVEGRRMDALSSLVDERLVVVMVEPAGGGHPTPVGSIASAAIQAHLLNSFLTGAGLREASVVHVVLATLGLAAVTAWIWLAWPWWGALLGVTALAALDVAVVVAALSATGLVLPLWPPLAAVVLASVAGLGAAYFLSVYRLRRLETENARVRETLVRQESAVESLEEDLDAARAAITRSTGAQRDLAGAAEALRLQLAEARAQEEATRRQLAGLEGELRGLRPAAPPADGPGEPVYDECAKLGIITRNAGVLALFEDLRRGARGSLPVLLLGEPGTGKELFARAAHALSPRASRSFVAVNMAAIPPELFESALFGHVRGSFTGAVADRKGHFAEADGGTLFLDEIGELRLEHQGKLLRALQEKSFHRVGASRATAVDVRVVAASNRDLERGIAEGWFREDLYFRLKGLVLRLPPLRERSGDVPLLAAHLVTGIAVEAGRPELALSEEAMAALESHDWPGNVRELENVLRQAVLLADGPVVTAKDLRLAPRPAAPARRALEADLDPAGDEAVLAALRQHRFDMQATARALGWDRSTVTQRLKGLGFRALIEAGGDHGKAALRLAGDPPLARTVELKLREYHEHLLRSVGGFDAAEPALAACRRRFKNLPDRHFRFLELLVRQHFEDR